MTADEVIPSSTLDYVPEVPAPAEELRFDGESGPFSFSDFLEEYGDRATAESHWSKAIPADSEAGRALTAAATAAVAAAHHAAEDGMEMAVDPEMEKRIAELRKVNARKLKRAELRRQRDSEDKVEEVALTASPPPANGATANKAEPAVVEDLEETPPPISQADYEADMEEMELEMERLILRKMKRAAYRKRDKQSLIAVEEDPANFQLALRPEDPADEKKKKKKRGSESSDDSEKKKKKMRKKMQKALANEPIIPKTMGPGMLDVVSGGKAGPVPTSKKQVCHRYLLGDCQNAAALCPFEHPTSAAECEKWAKYFMTLECKRGDACTSMKCLYNHPTGGPRINGRKSAPGTQL